MYFFKVLFSLNSTSRNHNSRQASNSVLILNTSLIEVADTEQVIFLIQSEKPSIFTAYNKTRVPFRSR